VANEMLFTIPEVFYRMKSRLLLSVLGCAALAFPALASWNPNEMKSQTAPPVSTIRPRMVSAPRYMNPKDMSSCQSSAASQIRHRGYSNVRFRSTSMAETKKGDQVFGMARADGWYQSRTFSYSCALTPKGYVTSANVAMH
jgi:hypothetical protein